MGEIDEKKKKIRGFAALVNSVLTPLNSNKKFKEKFSHIRAKILLNVTNLKFAALIIIEYGVVRVKSIPNKPKENLKKQKVGWHSFLELDTQTFLAIAMKQLSLLGVVKKWLTGEIKMRGIRKLIVFFKMLRILTNY